MLAADALRDGPLAPLTDWGELAPVTNQVRTELGLQPVYDFSDITSSPELQQKLKDVYGTVDNIDLWVGGLAEDHVAGGSMGETFRTILIDQFTRLRAGDRYWYQNTLSASEIAEVESTTLADVIQRNSGVGQLQANVFMLPNGD